MGGWLSAVIATNLQPPMAAEAVHPLLFDARMHGVASGALAAEALPYNRTVSNTVVNGIFEGCQHWL